MKQIFVIIAFLVLVCSCERNHIPNIGKINYDTGQITAGSVISFSVFASDEDNDPLSYDWTASHGKFLTPTNQKEVRWKAPADGEGQSVDITVSVNDGEISIILGTTINVGPPLLGNLEGKVSFRNIKIPLAGVNIRISERETTTDDEGNFEFKGLIAGEDSLHASKTDYNTNSIQVNIVQDQTVAVDVNLLSIVHSSKTYGIISDQHGEVVDYAQVIVLNPDNTESDLNAFSNTDGLFRIPYVPHGTRTVIVRKENNDDTRYTESQQDVEFTEIEQEVNLVITKESLIGEFTDPRDQQIYSFRKIGDYIWMTENLAYLPQVNHPSEQSEAEPQYYVYNHYSNDLGEAKRNSTFQQYGVLYNWVAAKQSCPPGWYLPSNFEYNEIDRLLGELSGYKMKSQSGWFDLGNGDNSTGFSAIPGGRLQNDGGFTSISKSAVFHTATSEPKGTINYFVLSYDSNILKSSWGSKKGGYAVRCVKGE